MAYKTIGNRATYFTTTKAASTTVQIATGQGTLFGVLNGSTTAQTNAMSLYDSATTTVNGLVPIATIKAQLLPTFFSSGALEGIQFVNGLVATFSGVTNADAGPVVLYGSPNDAFIDHTNFGNRSAIVTIPASTSATLQIATGKTLLYGITNADVAAQSFAVSLYDSATTTITGLNPVVTLIAPANTPTLFSSGTLAGVEFLNGIVATFAGSTNAGGGPGIICSFEVR